MIYKKEKDNIINDNTMKLKAIEKDIKDLETIALWRVQELPQQTMIQ